MIMVLFLPACSWDRISIYLCILPHALADILGRYTCIDKSAIQNLQVFGKVMAMSFENAKFVATLLPIICNMIH